MLNPFLYIGLDYQKSKSMFKKYERKPFQLKTFLLFAFTWSSLFALPSFSQTGFVKDIEGNSYKTIQIGNQIWMAENLKATKYNDGTKIPEIQDPAIWLTTKESALCFSQTQNTIDSEKKEILYNWFAVSSEKLCPMGWHVPSDQDWMILEKEVGLAEDLIQTVGARGWGSKIDGKLKSAEKGLWQVDRDYYSNETGFTAVPGGYRTHTGTFQFQKQFAYWWSSSSESENFAWKRNLSYYRDIINRNTMLKNSGLCVRCIQDQ